MKQEFTIYCCDICKKEYKTDKYPKELKRVDVMGRNFDCEGNSYSIGNISCDMCEECRHKLFEATSQHFALVDDCYGIKAVIKWRTNLRIARL